MRARFLLLFSLILPSLAHSAELGPEVRQLLVGIAPDWNSSSGTLVGLKRGPDGTWTRTLGPVPVLFGKNGLAWGCGVLGSDEPGRHKEERDKRAPSGVFQIGKIYTYDRALPEGADYPFHTITAADAWVDDPTLPGYNHHVVVDPKNPPPWFARQRMRMDDFAYRWLVEIRHNADSPVPGKGSCIFFHIRRGENRPTSGCTAMAQRDLISVIRWLRAPDRPHFALLPQNEYQDKWRKWGLPSPDLLSKAIPHS